LSGAARPVCAAEPTRPSVGAPLQERFGISRLLPTSFDSTSFAEAPGPVAPPIALCVPGNAFFTPATPAATRHPATPTRPAGAVREADQDVPVPARLPGVRPHVQLLSGVAEKAPSTLLQYHCSLHTYITVYHKITLPSRLMNYFGPARIGKPLFWLKCGLNKKTFQARRGQKQAKTSLKRKTIESAD
jgi:hypothetical protein